MERTLKLATLDIKRKGFLRNLIIYLISITCILFLALQKDKMTEIPSILLHLIPYIMLVNYSVSLTQEFTNKTDKIIFTGVFSRNEIMISKLISFIATAIICFIFYEVVSIVCNTFDLKVLFDNLAAFVIHTFTLSSFILLISAITSNFIVTGIVAYIFYFDLILILLNQILASSRNEMLIHGILNLPFYIVNTGFYRGSYTLQQSIVMIIYGILFLGAACIIINKRNI